MPYSSFTLAQVKQQFSLGTIEESGLFAQVEPRQSSDLLQQILGDNLAIALASNSEKARSEMIIAPILVELQRQFKHQVSLFSGVDFTVDENEGLNGICDFLISKSPERLMITAPVVTLVEAKRENLNGGLGQCIAEMVAAQRYNQQRENPVDVVYGTVTSGTNWYFLELRDRQVYIDLSEYYLRDLHQILGILSQGLG
jgi:hypothetical protein